MPAHRPRTLAPLPLLAVPLRSPACLATASAISLPNTSGHVMILVLDIRSRNVRSLPLHRECSLPSFQGSGHPLPEVGIATLPKSRCGPTPILPFLEDLVVCDVDHVAPRALSCHHACHELRTTHIVKLALTSRLWA